MNKLTMLKVVCLSVLFCAVRAQSVPVLDVYWGTGLNVDPAWNTQDIGISSGSSDSGVNPVTLTLQGANSISPAASMSTTAGGTGSGGYQGNYAAYGGSLAFRFTFNPTVVWPDAGNGGLQFYFKNGANTWYANGVSTPLVLGPQTYTIMIGDASNWSGSGSWSTDFANVTEIGFEVYGPNSGAAQPYIFSNMELTLVVPEPESIWMALIVLASLGITFRGRLSEVVAQVKARIIA